MRIENVVLITAVLAVFACGTQGHDMDREMRTQQKPAHHTASGFRNYSDAPSGTALGFAFYLRRFWGALFLADVPPGHRIGEAEALEKFDEARDRNTATWLGQSTFLLRVDGKSILTDPYLTEYASPFIRGPRRYVPPGIPVGNLPPVDIVLVSHDHHDHLDPVTVEALPDKDSVTVLVPLGLKGFFEERGFRNIRELDWRQDASIGGIRFVALPAVHQSGRGLGDRNRTLWCSWALIGRSVQLFFAGDTAYSPMVFKEIGKEFGPFDFSFVPIGAYEPRAAMRSFHVNPEEAVQIGLDLRSEGLIAMHWGTIELSDEPPWEPPRRFIDAARAAGYPGPRTVLMKIGETRLLGQHAVR